MLCFVHVNGFFFNGKHKIETSLFVSMCQHLGATLSRPGKRNDLGGREDWTFIRQVLVYLDSVCKDTGTDAKDTSVPYQGDTHTLQQQAADAMGNDV